jgi:hypothetical protein
MEKEIWPKLVVLTELTLQIEISELKLHARPPPPPSPPPPHDGARCHSPGGVSSVHCWGSTAKMTWFLGQGYGAG